MSHRREGLTILCALLAFFLSTGSKASADDRAEERAALQRLRASHLAAMGRCEEAVRVAEAASLRDAASEFLIGKCAIQAQQYGRALQALDRARALDPELVGVDLYRGIALYHLEDYDAARAALADARAPGNEAALLEFYNGLLLLREDKPRESALAFERAAARGPELVEPVASYYAALAWQSLDENEPLESAVDRVREAEPEGAWADEAEKLVALQAELHRGGQTGLQRWLKLRVGEEYDSNVVLLGNGANADLPRGIASEDDWRTVWGAELGAELLEIEAWTLGAQLSYAGNAHDDLDAFDQHYLVGTFWADRDIRPTTLGRLRMDLGAGWVDNAVYLYHLDLTAVAEERWGRMGTTHCEVGPRFFDYRYDIDLGSARRTRKYGDREDQDAVRVRVGCRHELPITAIELFEPAVYGGYEFSTDFARGDEWDVIANEVHLGLRLHLFFDIDLDARGTYTRRDFRVASYWAEPEAARGPDREDDALQADVELSKKLTDFMKFTARYQYVDNGSNTGAFDYKRHIAGATIELEFR